MAKKTLTIQAERISEHIEDGLYTFSTYAKMTAKNGVTGIDYVVFNDPDTTKNGYYHWDGAGFSYVEDLEIVNLAGSLRTIESRLFAPETTMSESAIEAAALFKSIEIFAPYQKIIITKVAYPADGQAHIGMRLFSDETNYTLDFLRSTDVIEDNQDEIIIEKGGMRVVMKKKSLLYLDTNPFLRISGNCFFEKTKVIESDLVTTNSRLTSLRSRLFAPETTMSESAIEAAALFKSIEIFAPYQKIIITKVAYPADSTAHIGIRIFATDGTYATFSLLISDIVNETADEITLEKDDFKVVFRKPDDDVLFINTEGMLRMSASVFREKVAELTDRVLNLEGDVEIENQFFMGTDLFFVDGDTLPLYRFGITNSIKVKKLAILEKATTDKLSDFNFDLPKYRYFEDVIYINSEDFIKDQIDIIGVYDQQASRDNFTGILGVTINKVTKAYCSGKSAYVMLLGGSNTDGGMAPYAKEYLATLGATMIGVGTQNEADDNSVLNEGNAGWGCDVFAGMRSLELTQIIYPHELSYSGPIGYSIKPNPFLFIADSTDKTNNPDLCFTFSGTATEPGVDRETSYAEATTAQQENDDFFIFRFDKYCTEQGIDTLDVMTVQLGINDIVKQGEVIGLNNIQLIMPFILSQFVAQFPSIKIGVIAAPAQSNTTPGNNFVDSYHVVNDYINKLIDDLGNNNIKVLSCQIHQNRDYSFDFSSSEYLDEESGNKTALVAAQSDYFHPRNNGYLELGKAVGMYIANQL
ncbi:hypothetical protein [Draconibacterium orientale]|uniref:hypothetical protein n=1 Tax=Draconibacterium orientale TaxID=1168034 RepID=UPI0029C048F6|nr:hypothetical protein [Draconibacterium orientale]